MVVQSIQLIADLRDQNQNIGDLFICTGLNNPGDSYGGMYLWEPLSTVPDDGFYSLQVTGVSVGRWIRIGASTNIYTGNGSLISTRTLTNNGYDLIFAGSGSSTTFQADGNIKAGSLAGTGTRYVVAGPTGLLNTVGAFPEPGAAIRFIERYVASANQTLFPTTNLLFPTFFDVYVNGVLIDVPSYVADDYEIDLNEGCSEGDIVEIIGFVNIPYATILPSISGQAGKFLTNDGTTIFWAPNPLGTVTNVSFTTNESGTDVDSSVTDPTTTPSITLSIPVASSLNTGKLSSADWIIFNAKQDAITLTTVGSTGPATFISNTLNIPDYSAELAGYVPTSRQLTINGTTYNLSADRTWSVGTVTSVDMTVPTGLSISGNPITGAGTLALTYAVGYSIPTNVKQGEWDDAYTWVSNFPSITGQNGKFLTTDGSVLLWAANPLGTVTDVSFTTGDTGTDVNSSVATSTTTPAITLNIPVASATNTGKLSNTDWTTFNNKQDAFSSQTANTFFAAPNGSAGVPSFRAIVAADLPSLSGTYVPYLVPTNISGAFNGALNAAGLYMFDGYGGPVPNGPDSSWNQSLFHIGNSSRGLQISGSYDNNNLYYRKGDSGWGAWIAVASQDWVIAQGYVPQTRELTINGTTYDLTADRSWSVGTVTSVDMSVPTGLAISGNPITGTGTLALTYASGYAIPTTAKQSNWDDAYTFTSNFPTPVGQGGKYLYSDGGVMLWNTIDLSGFVPTSRTLTINGTTYNLSADRTWSVGTVTSVSFATDTSGNDVAVDGSPVTGSGTITLSIPVASSTKTGKLSSSDWTTFNNKQNALTFGNLTESTSSVLTISGGSGAVIGTGTSIQVKQASGSQGGYLTSTDWTTFNSKQDPISLTTTGSSGAATFISNVLNIPNYTLSGLGGVPTSRQLTINGTAYDLSADRSWSVGTVTSVGISMPSAFNVSNSPVTGSGTLTVTGAGTTSQYIRGDGSLADFPGGGGGGGGASVSYYLNGGTNQGTFGGNTYYQMSKTAVTATSANFTINANGYIAEFLTDAGDPALLNIPAGNWDIQAYFSSSTSGGSPSFYVELYKYNGTTFTLISTGSGQPEVITGGTSIDLYYTSIAVPSTTLTLTDRLAIRFYVTHDSRTITMYTQDNRLAQIITTFTTGITAINGLTAQVQYFATGTSGSDFNISSVTDTHTFNLPVANSTKTGKLSSTDWTTFNNKQNALTFGNLTESTSSVLTVTGGTGAVIGSGTTIQVKQASGSQSGYLSSTDWTTFNSKLTNPMTTLGDIIYGDVAGAATRLAGNTTAVKQYLSQTGTGTASAAPIWATISGSDITGAALTKTDDTNVTLTLGGTPSTALLRAASLTLGWTGTLAISRGGTGASSKGTAFDNLSPMTTLGDLIYGSASGSNTRLAGNTTTTKQFLSQTGDGTNSAAPAWATITGSDITGAALTKTDDTNVTLTLGGTPATSLLRAASLTLGWTGQLAVSRGGTGVSTANANTVFAGPTTGAAAAPSFRALVSADLPALPNAVTFNNSGSGAASGTTYDGSAARTISYNTIGAQPLLTNPVTGTGTNNYIAKFTTTGSTIGNSTIQDDGTTVTVGGALIQTASASVIALNRTGGTTFGTGLYFRTSGTNNWVLGTAQATVGTDFSIYNYSTSSATINIGYTTNNIQVNSTTDAGYKFDVNGTTRFVGASLFNSSLTISYTFPTITTPFKITDGTYGIALQSQNSLNWSIDHDANSVGYIHWTGYNGGTTRFRDLYVGNGKNALIAYFDGVNKRFGVGTDTPEQQFDILTSGADPSTYLQIRASRTSYGNVRYNLITYAGGSGATDRFTIQNSPGDNVLNILGTGDTGFGTITPKGKVESKTTNVVVGDTAYLRKAFVANIPYSTSNITSSALAIYDGSTIHAANIGYAYDGAGYYMSLAVNSTTTGSPTEAIRITRSRQVGINTSTPDNSQLSVYTGTGATFRVAYTANNRTEIGNYTVADGYQQTDIVSSLITFATGTAGGGSATERGKFTTGGWFQASNNATYSAYNMHQLVSNSADNIVLFRNLHATTPYGPWIYFTAASPNNRTQYFLVGTDTTADRFVIWSDGGATFKGRIDGTSAIFSSNVTAQGGYFYGDTNSSFVRLDSSVGAQIGYSNYADITLDNLGITFYTGTGTGASRTQKAIISTGGYFGIGTSPSYAIDAYDSAGATTIRLKNLYGVSNSGAYGWSRIVGLTSGNGLFLSQNVTAVSGGSSALDDATQPGQAISIGQNYAGIAFMNYSAGAGTRTPVVSMFINNSNNVVIGDTSTTYKFDVNGTGNFRGDLRLSGGSDLIITPATSGVNAVLYNDIGKLVSSASLYVNGTGEFNGVIKSYGTNSELSMGGTGGSDSGSYVQAYDTGASTFKNLVIYGKDIIFKAQNTVEVERLRLTASGPIIAYNQFKISYTYPTTTTVPFLVTDGTYGVYVGAQNSLCFSYDHDANSTGYINWWGYNGSTTRFRDLAIANGKSAYIAYFDGVNTRLGVGNFSTPEQLVDIYTAGADPTAIVQIKANRTGYGNVRFQLATYAGGSASTDTFSIQNDGGTKYMTVLWNGNIGVNTTNPQGRFESKTANIVAGDAAYAKKAFVANLPLSTANVTGSGLAFYDGSSIHGADVGYSYDGTGYYMAFATNDDTSGSPIEAMRINRQQRVGIGVTNPGYKLDVYDSSGATTLRLQNLYTVSTGLYGYSRIIGLTGGNGLFISQNVNGTSGYASSLDDTAQPGHAISVGQNFGGIAFMKYAAGSGSITPTVTMFMNNSNQLLVNTTTSTTTGGFTNTTMCIKQLADGGSGGGLHIEQNSNTNVAFFGFDATYFYIGTSYRTTGQYLPIALSTNGSRRLIVSNSGRVSLNTSEGSDGLLYIRNSSANTYNAAAYNGTGSNIRLETAGAATGVTTGIAFGVGGASEVYVGAVQQSNSYADLVFQNYGGSYAERMRLTSAGELWIGYTSDQGAYLLQVNGAVYASAYYESSDIRLKSILNRHHSNDFDAIEYNWNDGRDSKLHWGYAAQEVMKFLPDAVSGSEELFYTLDYNQVHTYKIAMLEKRIAELESQLKNK